MRGSIKKFRWILGGAFVAILVVAVWAVFDAFYGSNAFEGAEKKVFHVSRNQTFASVVDSLESQGIIRNREWFVFVAKVLGGTEKIRRGRYEFETGISNTELFFSLREGRRIVLISVTIPEGLRSQTQARLFARAIGIDSLKYINLVFNEEFTRSLDVPSRSLDGYLMPETYLFHWQQEEEDVIRRQVREFQTFYSDSFRAKARELGWTTNQVMTMASIVEGEAILAEERAIISGVYWNRLKRGMRLQADPTIQFYLENGPRRVLYSDLKVDNPYNTYRYAGLPPGPVNNPGKASLVATLYPSRHNYLFFVANGKGGHWFTTSYAEHMKYVRQYRKKREAAIVEGGKSSQNSKGLNRN